MGATVNVNGRVFDQEHAVISVFDHGFLYGEGVYETLRTYNGQPLPSQGGSPGVASSASNDKKSVEDVARILMRYPIPNLDLLKIGFAF